MEAVGGAAEERWASLCNCVVNFLLEEKYHLTALELLQELQEDGRHAQALRLRSFFSDPAFFPPDLVARASSSPPGLCDESCLFFFTGADPQSLLEEKIAAEEKLALTEYDLRLAKEDLTCLKLELQKQQESSPDNTIGPLSDASAHEGFNQQDQRDVKISALGPLKDNERKDLNCAVKEYLLLAGYRLAAMTFIEEVLDQDLDVWTNSSACVPDALRRYYYQYLSSTTEAAEPKAEPALLPVKEYEAMAADEETGLPWARDDYVRQEMERQRRTLEDIVAPSRRSSPGAAAARRASSSSTTTATTRRPSRPTPSATTTQGRGATRTAAMTTAVTTPTSTGSLACRRLGRRRAA
ncbi:hypothetical protein CFC21_035233 [Triticum aestivum]|uniref:LisH domain-containing protein n=3 Tax=Triticum TaxID=4564 RepID=A0A9R0RIG5_TRITD|nr:hypothetical protein CFC21_035233 [Triticum aestivum]VAH60803.1 unnamed protein product [Triticum turgidum subsp. durum]